MHRAHGLAPAIALILGMFPAARAGWSSDPSQNLAVADGGSDQTQPKLAPGGQAMWVSWFDGIATGYDVRVQQLDAGGNEVFAHDGLGVADRAFTSTQDYGLSADDEGNALLAFRDDRPGSVQITAAKVTIAGAMPWGANGVQLTSTTDFVASPRIASAPDGGCVVAWTQNASTRLRMLDADGVPQWAGDVILTPATGSYSVSDLHRAGDAVILSFVHQTGGFGSPRHLLAQKFDAAGAALWDPAHVKVFDGGSLQFGNFPAFVPDGDGGAVFSWYDASSTALQCYVQHVLGDGTEAFAHNGVSVSTNATRVRVSPSVWFEPGDGAITAYWEELDATQSQSGVYGQRFDASGTRLWGAEGAVVVPVGAASTPMVRSAGNFVFWSAVPSFGQDRLYGARLATNGTIDLPAFDVASAPGGKSRLAVAPLLIALPTAALPAPRNGSPFVVLAWGDARDDDGDVYVQNVNLDGSLGPWALDVPVPAAGTREWLGSPVPNPSAAAVRFALAVPGGEPAVLRIVDAAGRLVRRHDATGASGAWSWDGRDGLGRRVASGVYFAELRARDRTEVRRVVRVR